MGCNKVTVRATLRLRVKTVHNFQHRLHSLILDPIWYLLNSAFCTSLLNVWAHLGRHNELEITHRDATDRDARVRWLTRWRDFLIRIKSSLLHQTFTFQFYKHLLSLLAIYVYKLRHLNLAYRILWKLLMLRIASPCWDTWQFFSYCVIRQKLILS